MAKKDPIDPIMKKLDKLDEWVKSQHMRNMSLVANGQRMANLLKSFDYYFDGNDAQIVARRPIFNDLLKESKELIQRWEKEFPKESKE